jgi:hypothetical protein
MVSWFDPRLWLWAASCLGVYLLSLPVVALLWTAGWLQDRWQRCSSRKRLVMRTLGPFRSDGCSGGMSSGWRLLFGRAPAWECDCIEHDRWYWAGGTWDDRLMADRRLQKAIRRHGHVLLAWVTYRVIRLFGSPFLPTPYRWGHGWTPFCCYTLEEEEDT